MHRVNLKCTLKQTIPKYKYLVRAGNTALSQFLAIFYQKQNATSFFFFFQFFFCVFEAAAFHRDFGMTKHFLLLKLFCFVNFGGRIPLLWNCYEIDHKMAATSSSLACLYFYLPYGKNSVVVCSDTQSCLTLCNLGPQPARLLKKRIFQGKNPGAGFHFLLQERDLPDPRIEPTLMNPVLTGQLLYHWMCLRSSLQYAFMSIRKGKVFPVSVEKVSFGQDFSI